MRCYYVLVHGKLDWVAERSAGYESGVVQPAGFYTHRYVLASNEAAAVEAAFRRVRLNLDRQMGWLRAGLATVQLEAEEVSTAPIRKLLEREDQGHTFYERE